MVDDEYNNKWPKTGTPAHNDSQPRGIDIANDASLGEKYAPYMPDPNCSECGGEGVIYYQVTHYDLEADIQYLDVHTQECKCVFEYMTVVADKYCKMCNGTGEVDSVHIHNNERVITHHSCLCLRFIPNQPPDQEEGVDK
ncbi:MAG: hypothetical protein HOC79_05590 [Euryarchaeota archaeon]|jgi:hypothetical protein|nr:hypothetical protein [Euryarchaeota archaeon]